MSEKLGHRLPDDFGETSPQKKLTALLETLEALQGGSHEGIPADMREAAILANKERIQELKAEHPELNN